VESGSLTSGGTNTYGYAATLGAKNYFFSFQLFKGGELYRMVSELIKVRQNLASKETYTLTEADLNIIYIITYNLDEGELDSAVENPGFYRSTDVDLVLPKPTRDGYDFVEWHDKADLTGNPVTQVGQGSTGNKDFYAEWIGTAKAITGFTIAGQTGSSVIDEDSKTVTVTVPWGTGLTNLTPTITVSDKAAVSPASGVARNFTTPVTYTVTAEDTTTAVWTVTVEWGILASGNIAAEIGNYLSNPPTNAGTGTVDDPIILPVNIDLASGWADLLTAISGTGGGKYVALDLSACTGMTVFDPYVASATGDEFIVSLVLPDAATSIKGDENNRTFQHFSALKSVEGKEVTEIGVNAFNIYSSSLTEVSFPAAITIGGNAFAHSMLTTVSLPSAETIGAGAFSNCSNLTEVNLPAAKFIGEYAFSYSNALKTVTLGSEAPRLDVRLLNDNNSAQTITVKVPSGATGYASTLPATFTGGDTTNNWGNAFRGKGWDGTKYLSGDVNGNITLIITYQ
jgi:uncharacterized repeat protein (TIGR02543 family)